MNRKVSRLLVRLRRAAPGLQQCSPQLQRRLHCLRRRRSERGMAVFLVVLVMTLVSAIGVFSMRSASLVDRATGFHRQNVQSTALVEFGARGAATWLGPHKSQITEAESAQVPVRAPGCAPALLAADPGASCWPILSAALTTQFQASAPQTFADGLTGQLSPPGDSSVLRAELVTEVTETFPANAAAIPGSSGTLKEVTLTTSSRIFPTDASVSTACGAASRGAVSQQRLRAHVIIQL